MKLHIFQIDQPRPHAIGHGHAVAHAAGLIRRVFKNLPQSPGGQNRFLGDDRMHFSPRGIQHVGPIAGEGRVAIRRVLPVVGECQEIHGDPSTVTGDSRRRVHLVRHHAENRMAGHVLGVNDAPRAVPPLARQFQFSIGIAIKRHPQFIQQEFLYRQGALAHEVLHRPGIRRVVTRHDDVLRQFFRRLGVVDDAPLRPVAVGRQGSVKREQFNFQSAARRVQRIDRTGQTGPDHQTICVHNLHDLRRGFFTGKVRLKSAAIAEWVRAPMLMTSTPGCA